MLIESHKAMQQALAILGYENPYHFSSMYGNVQDADMWMEAFRAKFKDSGKEFGRKQWDQLLGHVAAVTDAPCNIFGTELIDAYPEAKVVLVEREIEAWYRSWDGLLTSAFSPLLSFLSLTDPLWFGKIQRVGMMWMETQVRAKTLQQARQNSRDVYKHHYVLIRRVTPNEKLLEYTLGSGWEPLCKFLGKEVPDVPFPHANESETLKRVFEEMGIKAIKNSLKNFAMVGSGAVAAGLAVYWTVA